MRQVRRGVLAARRRPLRCLPSAVLSSAPRGRARGEEARTRQAQVRGVPSEGAGGVNVNATDVAAVAEDALVVLVMVWWWIIVALAPGYPYPAYGYPGYPYYPYPLPPAPSLGFGRGGIYGHVFVGRDESITSYTFPGRDSWQ